MAGRGRGGYRGGGGGRGKPKGPQGLCAYLVEVQETDGETTVPEDVAHLVRKCIEDKIFSLSGDQIAICRSDSTSDARDVRFVTADWTGLRESLEALNSKSSGKVGIPNPVDSLETIINGIIVQSKEDTYETRRILYFANLRSYVLDQEELEKIGDKLLKHEICLSIVLPNKNQMVDVQVQNLKIIEEVFGKEKYDDILVITNLKKAECQILNTSTKKATRPTAWNCPMEITPSIVIQIAAYPSTRKNKVGEMTRVLLKECESQIPSSSSSIGGSSRPPLLAIKAADAGDSADTIPDSSTSTEKVVAVELAKNALEKEKIFTDNDGNVIEEEDMGKAYWFGDKLVPYNELETEGAYDSGEKCFNLLAFMPPENINPAFHTGDGTTVVYPKKSDARSEALFFALFEAMVKTNRIALMRKVYRKGTRGQVGTLVPDIQRRCLVFTEVCFADDVSIPQFPLLVKPEDTDNSENVETNEKEELIDQLITAKSLEKFNPSEGPADPAVVALREEIAKKILGPTVAIEESDQNKTNTVGIFFRKQLTSSKTEETLKQIQSCFPLTENKSTDERFAGKNVFRKRQLELPLVPEDGEKKPKIEMLKEEVDTTVKEEPELNDAEMDDLLDEL